MNQRIGIVGVGLIGQSWSIVFARAGYDVLIYDDAAQALERCLATLQDNLGELAEEGLLSEPPNTVLQRITPVRTLQEAVQDAILVQENVRETLDAKQSIFSAMDRLAPVGTVLASSTSWIPASSNAPKPNCAPHLQIRIWNGGPDGTIDGAGQTQAEATAVRSSAPESRPVMRSFEHAN